MTKSTFVGDRRRFLKTSVAFTAMLAAGRAPALAKAKPRRLILAANGPPPELSAAASKWFCKQVTKRSGGELLLDFEGGTIITKEIEVINAVKTGDVAMGSPIGAAATVFPEMGVFLVPYLISSYDQAYSLFNGKVGDHLDKVFQKKYDVKILYFFDLGFRHFWNSRRPINTPEDLHGLKLRVQPSKVFVDTINGLGGIAVPMAWSEVITAAQQGVIDGADLPVANVVPLKVYEVTKYYSLTRHNYGPTIMAMNLKIWKSLSQKQQHLLLDVGREAQIRLRNGIDPVDSLAGAKKLLEPHGLIVNQPDLAPFKKVAREKVWPKYKPKYPDLWQKIVSSQA
jgi:tripartite ATP-independent transporter DctP family solute receptor